MRTNRRANISLLATMLALTCMTARGAENNSDTNMWDMVQPVPGLWSEPARGFAWYRRFVSIPAEWQGRKIRLQAGTIDDADDTFVNGHKIGAASGWGTLRTYDVAPDVLRFGRWNLIAIRVRNTGGPGGIRGEAKLFTPDSTVALNGGWEFRIGDDPAWAAWPMDPDSKPAESLARRLAKLFDEQRVYCSIKRANEANKTIQTVWIGERDEHVAEEKPAAFPLKNAGIVHFPEDTAASAVRARPAIKLPTGSAPIVVERPRNTNGPVVSVTDFGADVAGKDNCEAFTDAIAHCRKTKASRLVMPKGTYRFAQKRRVAFDGLKDIVIDGQGSELIFSEQGFINIAGCERVVLSNFILDWDWDKEPLAYIGKVTNVENGHRYVDFEFPQVKDISEKIKWAVIEAVDPEIYTPGVTGGWEIWGPKIDRVEKLKSNVLRAYPNAPASFTVKVGQVWRIRQYVYDCHAVVLGANTNLTLDNVTIYSAPGMGFVGGGAMHHLQFLGCRIVPRPGQVRPITTCADGLHLGNSQGYIRIENCEFTLMGDDAINIHDSFSMGIAPVDANTLVATNVLSWKHKYAAGNAIELRNPDYSPVGYTARLTAAGPVSNGACRMTFDRPLPANLDANTIIFNRTYGSTNLIIRNNYFHEHRARGMLLKFSDGLIEGNRFYKTSGNAMNIETGPPEGTLPRNLIFRNNTIEKCNLMNWGDGVINTGIYGIPDKESSYRVFEDILFERNTLVDNPGYAISLDSCKNIAIVGNTFKLSKSPAQADENAGALSLRRTTGVAVIGNKWEGNGRPVNRGTYVDTDTVEGFNSR